MFAAVTKDANNQLVLLAFGQMKKENLEMWHEFLRNVKADFPGIKLILCDKQKGLDACHNIYPVVRFGRCARHLLENTKDPGNNLGKITQEWELQFWQMVKAPTVEGYKEAYAAALKINSIGLMSLLSTFLLAKAFAALETPLLIWQRKCLLPGAILILCHCQLFSSIRRFLCGSHKKCTLLV